MLSHTECSAGGSHTFDNYTDKDVGGVEMAEEASCSKCDEVWFQKVYVPDPSPEYIDCDSNKCDGSENGHDWYHRKQEIDGRDVYYLSRCGNCDGSNKYWFRYRRNDYVDKHDSVIHSESA